MQGIGHEKFGKALRTKGVDVIGVAVNLTGRDENVETRRW